MLTRLRLAYLRELRPASLSLAVLLTAPVLLAGCDDDESVGIVEVQRFHEGVAKDTEGGAFRVTLTTREGLAVGENGLIVQVGFHDPDDPTGPGTGIPEAEVALEAWMPYDDGFVADPPTPTYLGEGRYLFEDLELDRPGIWQFDLDIAVGETLDEHVGFSFQIAEPTSP